jgi:polyvinyl alcohol dehydrogenase (cytochrome)
MVRQLRSVRAWIAATALLALAGLPSIAALAAPCEAPAGPVAVGTAQWNGWGRDPDNSRYQPEPALRATDVSRLAVKWVYGYAGTEEAGAPAVVDGRLFFGDAAGRVRALDARLGCTYWIYDAGAAVDMAVSVAELGASRTMPGKAAAKQPKSRRSKKHRGPNTDAHVEVLKAPSAVVFGDATGMIHAVDAAQGTLLWKMPAQAQPGVPLVGTPLVYAYAVYVSSATAQGAGVVSALDTRTGRLLWSAPLDVRSGPTVDTERQLLYVATAAGVAALDLADGRLHWQKHLPQADLHHAPILRRLAGARQVLVVTDRGGTVFGLDPARAGEVTWETRLGGEHGEVRIDWSGAADHRTLYLGSSSLGLTALDLASGKVRWNTPVPHAPSHAVTAIPGALFSGSGDGHLRAYSTIAGKVLWDIDTAHQYGSVSDAPATGGAPGHGGVIVVRGLVYLNAGNALLAFSIGGS